MDEGLRARRAQYREEMHYARRYSGRIGEFNETVDEVTDRLPGGVKVFLWCALISWLSVALMLSTGPTLWWILLLPVALFHIFAGLAQVALGLIKFFG